MASIPVFWHNISCMIKILKEKWMWLIYIMMFGYLIGNRAYEFFYYTQAPYLYYKILLIFSINQGHFPIFYIFAIASVLLNIAAFFFLYFYLSGFRKFSIPFISFMLIARIIIDIFGHSYEFMTIKSLYYQQQSDAWLTLINLLAWILPSYIAMGDYIAQKIKKNKKQNAENG